MRDERQRLPEDGHPSGCGKGLAPNVNEIQAAGELKLFNVQVERDPLMGRQRLGNVVHAAPEKVERFHDNLLRRLNGHLQSGPVAHRIGRGAAHPHRIFHAYLDLGGLAIRSGAVVINLPEAKRVRARTHVVDAVPVVLGIVRSPCPRHNPDFSEGFPVAALLYGKSCVVCLALGAPVEAYSAIAELPAYEGGEFNGKRGRSGFYPDNQAVCPHRLG